MKYKITIILVILAILASILINIEPKECGLDEKYIPRGVVPYSGENHDFVKAIWEDGYLQDWHIVIKDCEVTEFYESSKKYKVEYEYYIERHNKVMKLIKDRKW